MTLVAAAGTRAALIGCRMRAHPVPQRAWVQANSTRVRSRQMMASMPNIIELLQDEARACARCHGEALLFADGESRAYPVFQKDPPWPVRVMVVAEAPNFDDSFAPTKRRLTLEPDTDPSGAFMFDLLASVGLRPHEVLFTNSVLCLPARSAEGKHPVSARQQGLCTEWLGRFIDAANPTVVVTFGALALQGAGRLERHGLSLRGAAGKLHRWRNRHLLPLYHPGRLGRLARPEKQQREDISVLREVLGAVAGVDADEAKALMRANPDGARLVLRSAAGGVAQDLACSIGLRWDRSPVFAYLAPHRDGPPFWSEVRFFAERLSRRGDAWVIDGRHEGGWQQVEVHPLTDEERAAMRAWVEAMPADALDGAESAMRAMLNPRAL